jgi:hypothetical protein
MREEGLYASLARLQFLDAERGARPLDRGQRWGVRAG